jgi:hypothetical protein
MPRQERWTSYDSYDEKNQPIRPEQDRSNGTVIEDPENSPATAFDNHLITPETGSKKAQDLADNDSNNGKNIYDRLIELKEIVGMQLLITAKEALKLEHRALWGDDDDESLDLKERRDLPHSPRCCPHQPPQHPRQNLLSA